MRARQGYGRMMLSRRGLFGCSICAAAMVAPGRFSAAAAQRSRLSGIVDVHAHVQVREYLDFAAQHGLRRPNLQPGARQPSLSPAGDTDEALALRLSLMDQAGVRAQVLSPTLPPYLADEAIAAEAARRLNDAHQSLSVRYPGRLASYVSLPLPHIEASLAEMRRGLDELGMVGVTMQTSCGGVSIADERFWPLFAEMDRRGATLFLHPAVGGLSSPLVNDWNLAAAAGPLLEDTVVALHLMVKGIPTRFPSIKIIVPHLGGGLSTMLERLDNQLKQSILDLPEAPSVTAKRFWYDTVSHGSVVAMEAAVASFGADRLLPGSDFPVLLGFESYGETFAYINRAQIPLIDVEKIRNLNTMSVLNV